MVAERTLISELGLNSYEPVLLVPGMGKSVKKLLTGSLAQKNFPGDVYQQHCYITYGLLLLLLLFYSVRFLQVYFYARRVNY